MIKINFLPRRQVPFVGTNASISGEVLTVNSVDYDLSLLEDGATAQHPILGNATRNGSDYELTLELPFPPSAPEAHRFPAPIIVTDTEWVFDYDQLVSARL